MFSIAQLACGAQEIVVEGTTVYTREGPFGNKYILQQAAFVVYEGVTEVKATVVCAPNSKEPGRVYSVNWSLQGELLECCC